MYIRKYNEINWDNDKLFEKIDFDDKYVESYMKKRINIDINEDFVVNDYHVNKKYGMDKFGKVGSLVIDENYGIIDFKNGRRNERILC